MIPVDLSKIDTWRREFVARTGLGTSAYQITARSPWPSELLALHLIGADRSVQAWLEGGTYHGQAAEVLAHANPHATMTSVEIDAGIAEVARARLAPLAPRVQVVVGDGRDAIMAISDQLQVPTGVFLDGPKGFDAAILTHLLIAKRPAVQFVGCHDMSLSVPGRAVPARAALEELGRYEPHLWTFWATDDPEYVAWARDLDEGLHAAHVTEDQRSGWRPYARFAAGQPTLETRSYGPTVSFLIRARSA
ncbi:MAG: hypothetical protein Q8S13_03980 [Dehalococcoidia bacterium]|nr:hypothetical protein [Dehalococcoidia bacterium]